MTNEDVRACLLIFAIGAVIFLGAAGIALWWGTPGAHLN